MKTQTSYQVDTVADWNKWLAEKARIEDTLDAHPHIGTLIREGKRVFYVYPAGGEYREGTLQKLIG